jgi:hypothetical protein
MQQYVPSAEILGLEKSSLIPLRLGWHDCGLDSLRTTTVERNSTSIVGFELYHPMNSSASFWD